VNLAALWGLPLILVCENNGFAEFTPHSAHTVVERVSDVVAPYGFERHTVDGGDVTAVWDAFGGLLAKARGGGGPMLLECLTHRRRGHYEGDSEAYRDPVGDEEWGRRDPIARLTERAVGEGWLGERGGEGLRSRAAAAVEAAVRFARESPFPDPNLAESLVYAEG
jgi:pyruvate dehydrogenase E1 component alpha subunit